MEKDHLRTTYPRSSAVAHLQYIMTVYFGWTSACPCLSLSLFLYFPGGAWQSTERVEARADSDKRSKGSLNSWAQCSSYSKLLKASVTNSMQPSAFALGTRSYTCKPRQEATGESYSMSSTSFSCPSRMDGSADMDSVTLHNMGILSNWNVPHFTVWDCQTLGLGFKRLLVSLRVREYWSLVI